MGKLRDRELPNKMKFGRSSVPQIMPVGFSSSTLLDFHRKLPTPFQALMLSVNGEFLAL